jgi:hypothetical protein
MTFALCFLAFGFLISFLLTPKVIRVAQGGIGLDAPNESRKRHNLPIPRLGGIPIMLAVSLGVIVILIIEPHLISQWGPVLTGCLLMFGLGLWDDLKALGARRKLVGQIAIASLVHFPRFERRSRDLSWRRVERGTWSHRKLFRDGFLADRGAEYREFDRRLRWPGRWLGIVHGNDPWHRRHHFQADGHGLGLPSRSRAPSSDF